MANKERKNLMKWLKYILLAGFLLKLIRMIFMKKKIKNIICNFKNFFKEEKEEIIELAEGEESFQKYAKNSCLIFADYFIPQACNNYKPKILRTKSLAFITVSALLLKIALTAYLFLIYPSIGYMTGKIQDEIFNLINDERRSVNVETVSMNPILERAAQAKAEDMIGKNYFAHKSPAGKMVWDTINREEYPYLYVGENLAMNFTSANSAHRALMQSPSHKKNILNSRYLDVGIAVVNGEINGKQTNVLVQVFAHSKNENIAAAKTAEEAKESASKPAPAKTAQAPKTDSHAISKEDVDKITAYIKEAENKNIEQPVAVKGEPSKVLSAESDAPTGDKNSEEANKYLENVKVTPINNNKEVMDSHITATLKEIETENNATIEPIARAIKISQYIFEALLIFLVVALLLNILIRISVQHKSVIIQTIVVIVFIYGLLTIKLHFLETIAEKIIIS